MSKALSELQRILTEGQRRSMQGSYQRRNPAPGAVPFLLEARSGLKEYVESNGNEPQAWRLLSQAEECLVNYAAARHCLEKVMSLCDRQDKKDLKRLARLREYQAHWADLNLTPAQLADLGSHLRTMLSQRACDHSLRFTQEWLRASNFGKTNDMMDAIRNQGGYCDCEVLSNVVVG